MNNFYRILFFCFFVFNLNAQLRGTKNEQSLNDPKVEKLLKEIRTKINSLKAYKIEFTYEVTQPESKLKEIQNGIYTAQGLKFCLLTKQQEIYNNGVTVWTYLIPNKELQISDNKGKNKVNSPITMLDNFEKEYHFQFKAVESNSKDQTVVELIPVDKKKSVFKIDLVIDIKKKTILFSKFYEKSGVRQNFTITQFIENPKVTDANFMMDKSQYPKGVEVVDLRD